VRRGTGGSADAHYLLCSSSLFLLLQPRVATTRGRPFRARPAAARYRLTKRRIRTLITRPSAIHVETVAEPP